MMMEAVASGSPVSEPDHPPERNQLIDRRGLSSDMILSDSLVAFRTAMRRHAAGVCIISAGGGDAINGMAITAATSFSFDPPSVLVCINENASIASELGEGAEFGLAILGGHHEDVAAAFSRKPSGRQRFDHGLWRLEGACLPWLEDAPANLVCRVERRMTFGSHMALVGRVQSVHLGPDASSLIYRDGRYA